MIVLEAYREISNMPFCVFYNNFRPILKKYWLYSIVAYQDQNEDSLLVLKIINIWLISDL